MLSQTLQERHERYRPFVGYLMEHKGLDEKAVRKELHNLISNHAMEIKALKNVSKSIAKEIFHFLNSSCNQGPYKNRNDRVYVTHEKLWLAYPKTVL